MSSSSGSSAQSAVSVQVATAAASGMWGLGKYIVGSALSGAGAAYVFAGEKATDILEYMDKKGNEVTIDNMNASVDATAKHRVERVDGGGGLEIRDAVIGDETNDEQLMEQQSRAKTMIDLFAEGFSIPKKVAVKTLPREIAKQAASEPPKAKAKAKAKAKEPDDPKPDEKPSWLWDRSVDLFNFGFVTALNTKIAVWSGVQTLANWTLAQIQISWETTRNLEAFRREEEIKFSFTPAGRAEAKAAAEAGNIFTWTYDRIVGSIQFFEEWFAKENPPSAKMQAAAPLDVVNMADPPKTVADAGANIRNSTFAAAQSFEAIGDTAIRNIASASGYVDPLIKNDSTAKHTRSLESFKSLRAFSLFGAVLVFFKSMTSFYRSSRGLVFGNPSD